MNIETLKKSRRSAKGWVTRSIDHLKTLINNPNPSIKELHISIKDLERRLEVLDKVQLEIEVLLDDDVIFQADQDEAHKFRSEAVLVGVAAEEKLEGLMTVNQNERRASEDAQASVPASEACDVKLPKLQLPKFKGDVMEWTSFWDNFETHIDSKTISNVTKFTYLQSCLEGDALNVVKGLKQTNDNYTIAIDLLKRRFGRPEHIKFCHIQALLNIEVPSKNSKKFVDEMWTFQDKLLTHIRGLEALDVGDEQCAVFLTPIVVSRLPESIRKKWADESDGFEGNLAFLLDFLEKQIESLQRSETFKTLDPSAKKTEENTRRKSDFNKSFYKPSSASALNAATPTGKPTCNFCNKSHPSDNCFAFLRLSGEEKGQKIKDLGLCYRCLNKGHKSDICDKNCKKCGGPHNTAMCGVLLQKRPSTPKTEKEVNKTDPLKSRDTVGVAANIKKDTDENVVILQTAKATMLCNDGSPLQVRVMFDIGAGRTYVRKKMVQRGRLKWLGREVIPYSAFGGSSSPDELRNMYSVTLLDRNGNPITIKAAEIPIICQPLIKPLIPAQHLAEFAHLSLADDYQQNEVLEIDILIGLDLYWKFIDPTDAIKKDNLVAMQSKFGWTLSGSCEGSGAASVPHLLCTTPVSDADLHHLWDLETIGIHEKEPMKEEDAVLKKFEESVKLEDERYQVQLPWKSQEMKDSLLNNVNIAKKRLESLERKLEKDNHLRTEYYKVFNEYEQLGIIEEIAPNEIVSPYTTFYLSHHPVIKNTSTSTKVRPVLHANTKGYNGVSLNDCLEIGPSLNNDLVSVLLRFRRWPCALSADITKAYLQIGVNPCDRDVHRVLLYDVNSCKVRHMRFTRVPFGNCASPFLLTATLQYHFKKYPFNEVAADLHENMYSDNWLTGSNSLTSLTERFLAGRDILAEGSWPLTQVISNDVSLTKYFNENLFQLYKHTPSSVLGLKWFMQSDQFGYESAEFKVNEIQLTKRLLLSIIARIFDPLGKICPIVMTAKILLQEAWKLGIDWDDKLPDEIHSKLEYWLQNLSRLNELKFDRCYFKSKSWDPSNNYELHMFGDASEKGYGCCIYLRALNFDGTYSVSLVIAKSRVAPINVLSLPKLELMAAVIGARLIIFVKQALHLNDQTKLFCWTDSMTTLAWIKGDAHRWKTFVCNRVIEIQKLTSPSQWHYCPGKDNPADLITRGTMTDRLIDNQLWESGPEWLLKNLEIEGENQFSTTEESRPIKPAKGVSLIAQEQIPVFDISKFSCLSEPQRFMAYILRFINNAKKIK